MSVTIIGIGTGAGLGADASSVIAGAGLLIGGTRQLDLAAEHAPDAARWDLTGRLKEIAPTAAEAVSQGTSVVVLASGDPMFYGVGSYLVGRLAAVGIEARVLPAPSAIAVAAARFGLKWSDAHVISGHGRPLPDLATLLHRHGKLAILTDATNTPAEIGRRLTEAGISEGTAHVAEDLGSASERTRVVPIPALGALTDTSALNVVLLTAPRRHIPTIPFDSDDAFDKKMPKKGLITKREIRVLSLAALGVGAGDVCWDIGAGSGAVSIDMAHCGASSVWAVEKNQDGCEIVSGNVARHRATAVRVIHAKAPDGLADLPDPDRVFIGGSGGNLTALIHLIMARLRVGGTLVINLATVENLAEALTALRACGAPHESTQVQVSRSKTILGRLTRFEALNPITIIRATRPEELR
ncbi:MAG: precorrin-6y C5,15-methyltransferase (decarboxylating) subunit CbiE [Myxococcota bacterium]|nr:precorrin-6y C5,15-methyltransferase (decarboxylating) subunit CbiE [Myxococcota bacterium]